VKQINKTNAGTYLQIVFTVNSKLIDFRGEVTPADARYSEIIAQEMDKPHVVSARKLVSDSVKELKAPKHDFVRQKILDDVRNVFGDPGKTYAGLFEKSNPKSRSKSEKLVNKETVSEILEISLFIQRELIKIYGGPVSETRKALLNIIEKELEKPRLVQSRYIINDTMEEARGTFTKDELLKIFEEIKFKFGKTGKKFVAAKSK